jgi:UDP-N-acetylmuramyl pentapeptide phosphotransferase/UDP-N-acetylglucosamine-1-phosphate transferase
LVTYFFIPKIIFFAQQFRLTDLAGKRASHSGSTPIFGGIAIFSGILFSLLFWAELQEIQFLITSFLIVFFVGVIDDLLNLTPIKKLAGQIIAILVVIYLGEIQIDSMHGVLGVYDLPDFFATLFTVFVVIVITNGFNLIDGVDGLAAGVGVIAAFCFGFIAVIMGQSDMAIIAFSLVGALLAFLRYNFNPAKIFMGDTGSLVVGMILSVLAINTIRYGLVTEDLRLPNKGPLLAIVFLAIPLFDTLRVFVVRASKRKGPLLPGRDHIHHALLDLGFGHKKTTLILYFISIALIIGTYFLIELNVNLSIALLAFISYFLLILPFYLLRRKK